MDSCDQLAMALWLKKYLENTTNASTCAKVEEEWMEKYTEKLGTSKYTPRQVMATYLENMAMDVDQLDLELDWETWDDDPQE